MRQTNRVIINRMRCGIVAGWLVLTIVGTGLLAQSPQPATKPKASQKAATKAEKEQTPEVDPEELRILKESYNVGASLDADARTYLLIEQCQAAEDIPELGLQWCRELFQLAKDQVSSDDLRIHAMSAAAMAISISDADAGLQLLRSIDASNPYNEERSSAARVIFEGMLRKHGAKAIPDLLATAASLGDSGPYPYFATGVLLAGGNESPVVWREASTRSYSDAQVDLCNQTLQQALDYFKKSDPTTKANFQFLTLLHSAHSGGCASGYLVHQAATDFANEVVKVETAVLNGDEKYKASAGKALFDSAQRLLATIDPALSASVEKKVGAVRDVKSTQTSSPSQQPTTNSTWQNDPEIQALMARIGQAENILNNAPDGTTPHTPEMAQAIRDAVSASQKLVNKIEEVDPENAKSVRRLGANIPSFLDAALRIWPEATVQEIETLPDGELKAHLLLMSAQRMATNASRREQMRMRGADR